jgi:hypothetical protein
VPEALLLAPLLALLPVLAAELLELELALLEHAAAAVTSAAMPAAAASLRLENLDELM